MVILVYFSEITTNFATGLNIDAKSEVLLINNKEFSLNMNILMFKFLL